MVKGRFRGTAGILLFLAAGCMEVGSGLPPDPVTGLTAIGFDRRAELYWREPPDAAVIRIEVRCPGEEEPRMRELDAGRGFWEEQALPNRQNCSFILTVRGSEGGDSAPRSVTVMPANRRTDAPDQETGDGASMSMATGVLNRE